MFTHSEFADFGILNISQTDQATQVTSDPPENNFLDSTRQVSNQSEIFRDSALEGLPGYIGGITLEAQIKTRRELPQ